MLFEVFLLCFLIVEGIKYKKNLLILMCSNTLSFTGNLNGLLLSGFHWLKLATNLFPLDIPTCRWWSPESSVSAATTSPFMVVFLCVVEDTLTGNGFTRNGPERLRRSGVGRIERARIRTLKMTVMIGTYPDPDNRWANSESVISNHRKIGVNGVWMWIFEWAILTRF